MFRSRLFWKIFAAYAAVAVTTAWLFGTYLAREQRGTVEEQMQRRLRESALLVGSQVEQFFQTGRFGSVQRHLKNFAQQSPTRITLVDVDGRVLADSNGDPLQMDDHSQRPELVQARESVEGIGLSQRNSPTLGIPMMYYAVRLGTIDDPLGYVRCALPMTEVAGRVAAVRRSVWITAAAVTAVVLLLTCAGIGGIIRPLQRVTAAAQEIARGEFTGTLPLRAPDELGRLAGAFNSMSQKLAARIHESEARQQQLEANRHLLETILGTMVEGVVAVDAQQRLLFANDAARRLLDSTAPKVVGRPIWEVARHPDIQHVVQEVLEGRAGRRIELQFPRLKRTIDVHISRLPGKPGSGAVLVLHDVTELRRLERMRRDFVSNVSHELKTPLSAIQAYTETLMDGALEDEQYNRRFLQQIADQVDQLHALILDLLRLQRIESATETYEIRPVRVAEVLEACFEAHSAVAESKGIALTSGPADRELQVMADADELRTILDNLVDNALNYTPSGGRVTVSCASEEGMARIDVSDTGIGIPEEHQGRVFERFYRVDKARSRELGGTGLGLSIVKHLAQTFGGRVDLTSEVGAGSTFSVYLPLERISEPLALSAADASRAFTEN